MSVSNKSEAAKPHHATVNRSYGAVVQDIMSLKRRGDDAVTELIKRKRTSSSTTQPGKVRASEGAAREKAKAKLLEVLLHGAREGSGVDVAASSITLTAEAIETALHDRHRGSIQDYAAKLRDLVFNCTEGALEAARNMVVEEAVNGAAPKVSLEPQALRQFTDPYYQGPKIYMQPAEFMKKVEDYLTKGTPVRDGFQPFCKHLIVPNFAYMKQSLLRITPENEALLRTAYDAHTPKDLPVLSRFFPAEAVRDLTPDAKYLDIILYTREEIHQENDAKGMSHLNRDDDPAYGIMRIRAQDVDHELPMLPSTMIKNALSKEYGSGTPLNVDKYRESVAFWSTYAAIR